jgi:hypothetical protein
MREIRHVVIDIDRQLEDAARAKQQLDAQRWREELRPRAMRLFAARTAKLTWSRALLKLLVEELYPDDLFTELIGNLDRVPRRQWPHVVAIAVALRHSWRRDGLARIATRLHVSLAPEGAVPSAPHPTRRRNGARSRVAKRARTRDRSSGNTHPRAHTKPLRFRAGALSSQERE